jgi:hypothetical protein
MKTTAVEWLVDKLLKGEFINDTESLIEQAKEIEKQQIIDAYMEASPRLEDIIKESAEQYYNKTFKQ